MFGDPNSPASKAKDEARSIAKRIFANADVDIGMKEYEGDLYMTISLIRLPKDERKQGHGSAIMKALCDYADQKGIIVALSPTSEFGTGKATLMRFYKSFGFVPNKGRNKSYGVMDSMIRYPKQSIHSHITEAPWNKYDGQSSYADYEDDVQGDPAEKWLSDYTLQGMNKWPDAEEVATLQQRYGYKGGKLYRGLNFRDKEQWEEFLKDTANGTKLITGGISSWSPSEREARSFAITRPTYFLNRELMQDEDTKKKNKDYMIGHAGVILTMTVGPDIGIDVSKSKHGKETEVIMPSGEYQIEFHKTMMPFKSTISNDNFRQEFLSIKSIKGDDNAHAKQKFEHIMFHYKEFDQEMSHHLYNLITESLNVKHYVEIHEMENWKGDQEIEVVVQWNIPVSFFYYYDLLLPNDRNQIDDKLEEVIDMLDDDYLVKIAKYDLTKIKFDVRVSRSLQLAMQMERVQPKFIRHIRNTIGNRYAKLNSRENVRSINNIKDPKAKQAAISQMAAEIQQLLKQIQ
jgi:hypothetical protein